MPHSQRLGITIGLVWLGMMLSILVTLPPQEMQFLVLGSELSLRISGAAQLAVLMSLFVCIGVEAVLRSHPLERSSRPVLHISFWGLPVSLTFLALLGMRTLDWWVYQMILVGLTGLALALVVSLQYQSLSPAKAPWPGWAVSLLTYGLELTFLIILYGLRWRSVLSATGILIVSSLLALGLFHTPDQPKGRQWFYALLIGELMGEFTWALNYLSVNAFVGGGFLFLVFYVATGLLNQGLSQPLTRRIVIEYGILAAIGLAFLGYVAF